eukprot:EG_transcript_28194
MDALLNELRWSADYFTKLDTDEFLVKSGNNISVEVDEVLKAIHDAKLNGHRAVISATLTYEPDDIDVCWPLGQKFAVSREVMKGAAYAKGFLPAPTFAHADLGFHSGESMGAFNQVKPIHLATLHFHFLCYEEWIRVSREVVVSHGYIDANDSKEEQLRKLSVMQGGNSIHKVWNYLHHLQDEEKNKKTLKQWAPADYVIFPAFNELMSQIEKSCF